MTTITYIIQYKRRDRKDCWQDWPGPEMVTANTAAYNLNVIRNSYELNKNDMYAFRLMKRTTTIEDEEIE